MGIKIKWHQVRYSTPKEEDPLINTILNVYIQYVICPSIPDLVRRWHQVRYSTPKEEDPLINTILNVC
jgi:hypothetical protein